MTLGGGTMKIVLEKRNSPSFRNDLKKFEIFSAIVDSLRESTYIELETEEEQIVLRNGKYYLAIPAKNFSWVLDCLLEGVVLRRTLNNLELLTLYALFKQGVVKAGRVEEISSSESEVRSRIIEVVS